MPSIIYHIGTVLALCVVVLPFIIKKSKAPDPEEEKKEKEFNEQEMYGEFQEFIWRKKKHA